MAPPIAARPRFIMCSCDDEVEVAGLEKDIGCIEAFSFGRKKLVVVCWWRCWNVVVVVVVAVLCWP